MVLRVHVVVVAVHQRAGPRAGGLLILVRLRAHGPVCVVYQLYLLLWREDLRAPQRAQDEAPLQASPRL